MADPDLTICTAEILQGHAKDMGHRQVLGCLLRTKGQRCLGRAGWLRRRVYCGAWPPSRHLPGAGRLPGGGTLSRGPTLAICPEILSWMSVSPLGKPDFTECLSSLSPDPTPPHPAFQGVCFALPQLWVFPTAATPLTSPNLWPRWLHPASCQSWPGHGT